MPSAQGETAGSRRSSITLSTACSNRSDWPVETARSISASLASSRSVVGSPTEGRARRSSSRIGEGIAGGLAALVLVGEVERADDADPRQHLVLGRQLRQVAIEQLTGALGPHRQAFVRAPAVGLHQNGARDRQALASRVAALLEQGPGAREAALRRRVVGHVSDAEPVVQPGIHLGLRQPPAPFDEGGATALGDDRGRALQDQAARLRPGAGLQRQDDGLVDPAGVAQDRRRLDPQPRLLFGRHMNARTGCPGTPAAGRADETRRDWIPRG